MSFTHHGCLADIDYTLRVASLKVFFWVWSEFGYVCLSQGKKHPKNGTNYFSYNSAINELPIIHTWDRTHSVVGSKLSGVSNRVLIFLPFTFFHVHNKNICSRRRIFCLKFRSFKSQRSFFHGFASQLKVNFLFCFFLEIENCLGATLSNFTSHQQIFFLLRQISFMHRTRRSNH